jgi:hypothetical protein
MAARISRTWKTVPIGETEDALDLGLSTMRQQGISVLRTPTLADFLQPELRGAIVGKVDIVGCVPYSSSPWFFGRYGFVLKNPVAFSRPVPFKGELGFFDVPDELVREAA